MPTSTNVTNLKINELTEAQYDTAVQQGIIGANELSILTDADTGGDFVPQYTTMPTASASNVGEICQFAGTTDATYTNGYFYKNTPTYSDPSATISQTVGSGLTDLAVNVTTFESAEQPSGDETVNFVAASISESINPTQFQFDTAVIEINQTTFLSMKTDLYGGDWANVVRIYFSYDGDNDSFGAALFDADNNELSNSGGLNPTMYGISVVSGTLPSSGSWGTNLSYTPADTQWSKGGNTVTLADYGISFTGTPNDGDVLTVAYTAPAISGYAWERTDVQPAGATGIEWAATVDLPANSGLGWGAYPIYTIAGGLQQGTYEFYWQIMDFCAANNNLPAMPRTYKARFTIDQDNNCYGGFMPVINDAYFPNDNSILQNWTWYNPFKVSGSDWLLYNSDYVFWQSTIAAYVDTAVPECFKISAIVNVDTGEKIIPTGALTDGNSPIYDSIIYGTIKCENLVQEPSIPSYFVSSSIIYDDNDQYIRVTQDGISGQRGQSSCSELDVALESDTGGTYHVIIENGVNTYTANVLEATGDLANAQIGYADNNEVFVYLNTTAGTTGTIYGHVGCKGANTTPSFYVQQQPYNFVAATILEVGSTIQPETVGKILQYTGTTTASYTHGYFYEATGTIVTVPISIPCTETTSTGTTITCSDATGFVSALQSYLGWSIEYLIDRLSDTTQSFTYEEGQAVIYWSAFGELPASDFLSFFTFSPALSSGVIVSWSTQYTPAHQEVQNGAWVQVNTQPGATTPSTMPTLTVAGWSSNTQTVTVNGVTTTNNVLVAPAPASAADWTSAGVICTAQGTNSLTFTCTQTPSNDITVNVCILG